LTQKDPRLEQAFALISAVIADSETRAAAKLMERLQEEIILPEKPRRIVEADTSSISHHPMRQRHPVKKAVKEYLNWKDGWAQDKEIVNALKEDHDIPDDATLSYLNRAARNGELEKNGAKQYRLSAVAGAEAHGALREEEALENPPSKTPAHMKTREEALDYIQRAGSMGLSDWQLEKANVSITILDELLDASAIVLGNDERYYATIADEPGEAKS